MLNTYTFKVLLLKLVNMHIYKSHFSLGMAVLALTYSNHVIIKRCLILVKAQTR